MFKGNRAIGVEYIRNNTRIQVHAKKEVILSAGAVGSPQLLMVSGVGPKDHLEKLKVSFQLFDFRSYIHKIIGILLLLWY